jgi:uncharacterized protein (TIGR00255 family)
MIRSMTGYGSAKGGFGGLELTVELKSVNNRFLDVTVRIPRGYIFAEETIKTAVGQHITRGKADVFVTVDSSASDDAEISVNLPLARGYARALRELSEALGVNADLTAPMLARLPDVLSVTKKETDRDAAARALTDTLEAALTEYDAMREREGAAMRRDIEERLSLIASLTDKIERRSPETVKEYRERLHAKMSEVLGSSGIDEQRVLQEAAIYADRVDVCEETVRLRSHVSQMRELLETGSPAGRKLDFIVQEMNRETNTCGSKVSDFGLGAVVIEIKSEIEKIKEQIQNIE